MNCRTCGREIIQGQDHAETPEWFAKRLASGYCRPRCKKTAAPVRASRPLPSLEVVSWNHERGEGVAQPKEKPAVDERYRKWVREMMCIIPGCPHEAQFHHQNEKGHGAKGAVCSDYRGLPLCSYHHTLGGTLLQPGSYHGTAKITGWRFWSYYGVDVEATIHRLNAMWLEKGNRFKNG